MMRSGARAVLIGWRRRRLRRRLPLSLPRRRVFA